MKVKQLHELLASLSALHDSAGNRALAEALDKLRELFDDESDLSVARFVQQIRAVQGTQANS